MNPYYPEEIKTVDVDGFKKLIGEQIDNLNSLELIVIKGHILIEYALTIVIEKLCKTNSELFLKDQFRQKLKLVQSFGLFNITGGKEILIQINLLTEARNQIAHHLRFDPNILENLLKHYQNFDPIKTVEPTDKLLAFKGVINAMCAHIVIRLDALIMVNNEIANLPQKQDIILSGIGKWNYQENYKNL
jgi:hypothetical protein